VLLGDPPIVKRAVRQKTPATHRVAVVTGGGSGLGRDVANRLTHDGFTVAVLGRRATRLEPRRGEQLCPYVCDVADNRQIKRTIKAVLADLGRIDVLVNAAGIARSETAAKITQEAIRATIDTNLIGTINVSLACVPALKRAKGAIVNLSSTAATRPMVGTSVYSASKGGIDSFTRALALELGPAGVRVNAVSPSIVRSEILVAAGMDQKSYDKLLKERGRTYPLGRAGEPEDVSELISYLAADGARWMTGAVIPIDGGKSAA
jgi:meso-butanediol dehydrogenase/(S,S)-butanediol dehydrogenase/diacetyl reductase